MKKTTCDPVYHKTGCTSTGSNDDEASCCPRVQTLRRAFPAVQVTDESCRRLVFTCVPDQQRFIAGPGPDPTYSFDADPEMQLDLAIYMHRSGKVVNKYKRL